MCAHLFVLFLFVCITPQFTFSTVAIYLFLLLRVGYLEMKSPSFLRRIIREPSKLHRGFLLYPHENASQYGWESHHFPHLPNLFFSITEKPKETFIVISELQIPNLLGFFLWILQVVVYTWSYSRDLETFCRYLRCAQNIFDLMCFFVYHLICWKDFCFLFFVIWDLFIIEMYFVVNFSFWLTGLSCWWICSKDHLFEYRL